MSATDTAGPKPATPSNGQRIFDFIKEREASLNDDVIALLQGEANTAQAERAVTRVSELAGIKIARRDLALARAEPDPPPILNLADVHVEDAQALLIDRYHPTNHTIVYGPGGVGKGTLLANDIIKLAQSGTNVAILDYERHPEEWRPRIFSLGGADLMDDAIGYWTPPAGAIWDHVDTLQPMLAERKVGAIVIDSVTFACAGADTVGDPRWCRTRSTRGLSQFLVDLKSPGHLDPPDHRPGRWPPLQRGALPGLPGAGLHAGRQGRRGLEAGGPPSSASSAAVPSATSRRSSS